MADGYETGCGLAGAASAVKRKKAVERKKIEQEIAEETEECKFRVDE